MVWRLPYDVLRRKRAGCRVSHCPQQHDSDRRGNSGEQVRLQGDARHTKHRSDARPHRRRSALSAPRARQQDRRPQESQLPRADAEVHGRGDAAPQQGGDDSVSQNRGGQVRVVPRGAAGIVSRRTGGHAARRADSDQEPVRDAPRFEGARDASSRPADDHRADARHRSPPDSPVPAADGAGGGRAARAVSERFTRFSPKAIAFLRALKRNNDREWFRARKEQYDELLRAPMIALLARMAADLRDFAPELVSDPRVSLYRIYRDTRF